MANPIRVLLVDSSPLALRVLQQILASSPDFVVAGTARHGREALRLLPTTYPDVVCLAAQIPLMDAPELTREIMSQQACPILIITSESSNGAEAAGKSEAVAACLQAGAVDVFKMPAVAPAIDSPQAKSLLAKIRLLARIRVISRSRSKLPSVNPAIAPIGAAKKMEAAPTVELAQRKPNPKDKSRSYVIAIGASTGGPQVLLTILSALPRDYPFPILCVQHISRGFIVGLVDWLNDQCKVKVKVAAAGEILMPGTVYFPEDDRHLGLEEGNKIKLSPTPPVDGHRPSVTSLFDSVAHAQRSRVVAVLLTGMGADGAQGIKSVHEAGGTTIVQDNETCIVFGMPGKAIQLGVVQHVLPPTQIARYLLDLAQTSSRT